MFQGPKNFTRLVRRLCRESLIAHVEHGKIEVVDGSLVMNLKNAPRTYDIVKELITEIFTIAAEEGEGDETITYIPDRKPEES